MGCRIGCLQFFLVDSVENIAFLAEVEIKAVFTLIAHTRYRVHLAAVAFDILSDFLAWLDNKFNPMCFVIMPSDFQFALVILSGEIAVLAHAKMNAVGADKAASDNGPHIAAYAFVVIVRSKTVG